MGNSSTKKIKYDESISCIHFLKIKDEFLEKYLKDIKGELNLYLDNNLHMNIIYNACELSNDTKHEFSISQLKENIIKLYQKYYNIQKHNCVLDISYKNFKYIMNTIVKELRQEIIQ